MHIDGICVLTRGKGMYIRETLKVFNNIEQSVYPPYQPGQNTTMAKQACAPYADDVPFSFLLLLLILLLLPW